MKIKRIHTDTSVISLGYHHTFDDKNYQLSYLPEYGMFQIDNVLIPHSNIREVLTEGIEKTSASTVDSVESSAIVAKSGRRVKDKLNEAISKAVG